MKNSSNFEKQNLKTRNLTMGALIGALYIIFTLISQAFGLASGVIQLRISEALTILPLFTSTAVPGLAIGCLISNIMTGCAIWDIAFGTIATLLGAIGTYLIGRSIKAERHRVLLGSLSPVVTNVLIVPYMLKTVYGAEGTYLYFVITIGLGEILSCMILGSGLYFALKGKLKW